MTEVLLFVGAVLALLGLGVVPWFSTPKKTPSSKRGRKIL